MATSTPESVEETVEVGKREATDHTRRGSEFTGETSEGSRKKANQKHSTLGLEAVKAEEIVEKEMMDNSVKKRKGGARDEIQSTVPAHKNEGKSRSATDGDDDNTETHDGGLVMAESDEPTTKPERRETEDKAEEECVAADSGAHIWE